ncbi:hypothetical protein Tsubulata_010111 [Turnera subulata]|uniref:Metallothionein-like protein n=1 Tax=Turnera subulata TaxID=218843 RepID=A0A9Q0FLB1_9ROSI|nr:hypothetical protein Tsubulata_010111 [Turnera subulata]
MSDTCGNCDCADKAQCVKKGTSYTVDLETEKSFVSTVVMEVPAAAENDGKCKCGTSCTCTDCTCGH